MVILHKSIKTNGSKLSTTSEGTHSWPQDSESREIAVNIS